MPRDKLLTLHKYGANIQLKDTTLYKKMQ
jgi:hypothetical protein